MQWNNPFRAMNWMLLFILIAVCSFSGIAQHTNPSDKEISEQLNLLAQAESPYFAYDTTMSIPVDSLIQWLLQQGGERNKAIVEFLNFHFLHPNNTRVYESMLAGNTFYKSRKLLPINFQIEGLGHLAECYEQAGRYQERLAVITEICELKAEHFGKEVCVEIAKVFYDLRQFETAIKSYRSNAEFFRKNHYELSEASSYNDIGNCFVQLGQTDSAIANFQRALKTLEKPTNQIYPNGYIEHFRSIIKWNLLEEIDTAKFSQEKTELIKEITDYAEGELEIHWMLRGYMYLAELGYARDEYQTAIAYCDTGIAAARKFSVGRKIPQFRELKGKIYLLLGEKAMAEEQFSRATFVRDSVELASSELQATASAAFYESREKEEQIAALGLKAEEEKRRTQNTLIGAVLATLIAILLGVLAISVIRSRKQIREQSKALQVSLKDKEVLLKEIHHRVKNNLQVVSSLLDLQSIEMDDGTAKSALDEGKSRVQSIAILHHQLYQHDDLAKVELSAFTKELFTQVQGVFNSPGQEVEINIDMKETMIDIDAAVPLGLILNELCTNSFKYAFDKRQVGKINVVVSESSEHLGTTRKLVYRDNGPGLPENFDLAKAKSLGLRLISKLSKQFKGSSSYRYNEGAEFTILF